MTTYPLIGFPDYARLDPEGGRYLTKLTGAVNTNPATPVISSTGFRYILLQTVENTAGANYQVVVNWGFNSDGAIRFTSTFYTPNTQNQNQVVLPVMGEWFTVEHQYYSGTGTLTPVTYIYGTNEPPVTPPLGGFGGASFNGNPTIAGPGNFTQNVAGIHNGKATFAVGNANTAQWFSSLLYYDPTVPAYTTLYTFDGGYYGKTMLRNLTLPPAPIQIIVDNQSAAATAFTVSLIPG